MVLLALLIKPVVFYFFGMYRRMWVYASVREVRLIAFAVTAASILLIDRRNIDAFLPDTPAGIPGLSSYGLSDRLAADINPGRWAAIFYARPGGEPAPGSTAKSERQARACSGGW